MLYSMLALRDEAELWSNAVALIARVSGNQPELAEITVIVQSLSADASQIDRAALDQAIAGESGDISGDDLIILNALAARRADGDTWQAFRARMPNLLRDQPLSGHVVVLLNRLAKRALPLAASRS